MNDMASCPTDSGGSGKPADLPPRLAPCGPRDRDRGLPQPWHEQGTFHPLPPEKFAGFNQLGYVKIAWTLAVEPLAPNQSLLVTRTRAVATDPQSRKRFRRYWAPMSAGIILIRYAGLPRMRKEAERRATHAGPERQHGVGNGRRGVVIEHAVDIQRFPRRGL